MSVAHPGSWLVQPTRETFQSAHAAQLPRLLVEGQTSSVARAVDSMVTAQWMTKFAKPRPLSGVAPVSPQSFGDGWRYFWGFATFDSPLALMGFLLGATLLSALGDLLAKCAVRLVREFPLWVLS